MGTVQVPTSWRPIVQDCEVMKLFFEIYSSHPLPASKLALQGLVLMSSIRRSVFTNDKERSAFLECLMMNIERIMTTRVGLQGRRTTTSSVASSADSRRAINSVSWLRSPTLRHFWNWPAILPSCRFSRSTV